MILIGLVGLIAVYFVYYALMKFFSIMKQVIVIALAILIVTGLFIATQTDYLDRFNQETKYNFDQRVEHGTIHHTLYLQGKEIRWKVKFSPKPDFHIDQNAINQLLAQAIRDQVENKYSQYLIENINYDQGTLEAILTEVERTTPTTLASSGYDGKLQLISGSSTCTSSEECPIGMFCACNQEIPPKCECR
jgi:c-di-AMP phosphodiesterase-like protein